MWGRATFAMEVSRTSMKAASATVAAISQGLTPGFHRPLLPTSPDICCPFRSIERCQIQQREPSNRGHIAIPCEPFPLNALSSKLSIGDYFIYILYLKSYCMYIVRSLWREL